MATCKDCIHHGVCGGFTPTDLDHDVFDYCREGRTDEIPDIEERCNSFKDKSRFVELPCKVGDVMYNVETAFNAPIKSEIYEICFRSGILAFRAARKGYFGFAFTENDIGKTVFFTREEAEAALSERTK